MRHRGKVMFDTAGPTSQRRKARSTTHRPSNSQTVWLSTCPGRGPTCLESAVQRKSQMKFALISHKVPPAGTGQSLVIYRMLRDMDPESYCLISTEQHNADE